MLAYRFCVDGRKRRSYKYDDLIHHTAYAVYGMLSCYRISTALAFNQRKPETAQALRK